MRPEALDLDVALLDVEGDEPECFIRRDERWAHSRAIVKRYARPLTRDVCLPSNTPLRQAISPLLESSYLMCTKNGKVDGIVTLADFQKPAASLAALGILLPLEEALGLLFPSLTDRRWMSLLGEQARDRVRKEIAQRKRTGTYLSDEDCLYLSDKVRISSRIIPPLLSISNREWKTQTGRMVDIRNDLAHGRTLLSRRSDPRTVLGQLHALDSLRAKLVAAVEDRADVWEKYARTICLVREGRNLVPLPHVRARLPERFWMLSAQNPFERVLPEGVNRARHDALVETLRHQGHLIATGVGRAPVRDGWSEDMVLARSIGRETACRISSSFGQRSVFEFEEDEFRVIDVATGRVRKKRLIQ